MPAPLTAGPRHLAPLQLAGVASPGQSAKGATPSSNSPLKRRSAAESRCLRHRYPSRRHRHTGSAFRRTRLSARQGLRDAQSGYGRDFSLLERSNRVKRVSGADSRFVEPRPGDPAHMVAHPQQRSRAKTMSLRTGNALRGPTKRRPQYE